VLISVIAPWSLRLGSDLGRQSLCLLDFDVLRFDPYVGI